MLPLEAPAEHYRACQSALALQQLPRTWKVLKRCCQGPRRPRPPPSLRRCLPQGPCQPRKCAPTSCMVSALCFLPL